MTDLYDDIEKWLRKASDDEIDRLLTRAHGLISHDRGDDWTHSEPVVAVEWQYMCLMGAERDLRRNSLAAMEADMNGGHRVVIAFGDGQDTFAAYCDPRPGDEPPVLCWHGPDRLTVDDAVNDGRFHLPGVEPEVVVGGQK